MPWHNGNMAWCASSEYIQCHDRATSWLETSVIIVCSL
uniref:Uncharacterized protein n=1 Tax=Arundo donax TaxID=35708 RepID=A0A0A9EDR9_ARUDO